MTLYAKVNIYIYIFAGESMMKPTDIIKKPVSPGLTEKLHLQTGKGHLITLQLKQSDIKTRWQRLYISIITCFGIRS